MHFDWILAVMIVKIKVVYILLFGRGGFCNYSIKSRGGATPLGRWVQMCPGDFSAKARADKIAVKTGPKRRAKVTHF